ncbi:4-hydroxybenzoate transporter [Paraburkholderia ginsengiterrae]|uniref:4-hydroxybenzoate transporter n=1 Tax=Paraburkholderia ginsengiterrae TaxID=1462993 RepID=A0A1A9N5Q1_9BURK|nr:4-hydroxybenzoate transporter [Paraburkholderia ginsengiterrae]OAJ60914.1 4-hydroxybenzoate transporter [Paraburkholderia ginsengiterrae]
MEPAHASIVDISALIDSRPLSTFQKWIMVMIGCSVVMDGFDVQTMGFVAPAIVQAWHISPAELGPVFGAGLLGMLVGSIVLGAMADSVGRRPVLVGATVFYGLCMLAASLAQNVPEFLVIRFLTGLGIGGVMGNAIALVSEYSPQKHRASLMTWVSCGFTGGAIAGGLLCAALLPSMGWRSVFLIGGILPLIIAVAMLRYLPESLQLLVLKERSRERIAQWLKHIAPDVRVGPATRFAGHEQSHAKASVGELFRHGRSTTTLLLWGINFANLLDLFFLSNWLPMLSLRVGHGVSTAVLIGTSLQVGGTVGALLMGPLMDRFGFYRVLTVSFLLATVAVASVGLPDLSTGLRYAVVLISGVCIVGGQPAVNALTATLYPTSLRATGVGWSLGIGRAGSIIGPVVAGQLIRLQWSNSALFVAAAVPALASCLMLVLLSRTSEKKRIDCVEC